ncbi:MAG: hypothetical protein ACLFPE_07955 [Bacteroidales bacterium]
MKPLHLELQIRKHSLEEFKNLTVQILHYLPNIISGTVQKGKYDISVSEIAGTKKYVRPINRSLFINDPDQFTESYNNLLPIFERIRNHETLFSTTEKQIIDSTLYTVQQAIGAGLDLLVAQNSARKHVGNRFEELIATVFETLGVTSCKMVLQIPYETDEGTKVYKCENDLILSPYAEMKSNQALLDENEIVLSVKTTSKDRMGKMFIDKILLEKFVRHPQKVIGVFLNDVQRKEGGNISYTLVSGLFMVYTQFLTQLEGIYYLDPPPVTSKEPYNRYIKRFADLITDDLRILLPSQ